MWSTIESQINLRRCTIVGAQMLLLWSISPLGGQASLRALEKSREAWHSTIFIDYLDTNSNALYARDTQSVDQHNQLYASSLMATPQMKLAPMGQRARPAS